MNNTADIDYFKDPLNGKTGEEAFKNKLPSILRSHETEINNLTEILESHETEINNLETDKLEKGGYIGNAQDLKQEIDTKSNIYSPTFTGNPTAPTPSLGDNSTKIATTAFVNAMLGTITTPAKDFSSNGYVKMANGLILQWGTIPAGGSLALPIAFPNAVLKIVGASNGTSGLPPSWAQLRVTCNLTTASSNGASDSMNFIAIGY